MKSYINQKHCYHAEKQAGYAKHLHASCQVKPAAQLRVLTSCAYDRNLLVYASSMSETAENSRAGVLRFNSSIKFSFYLFLYRQS